MRIKYVGTYWTFTNIIICSRLCLRTINAKEGPGYFGYQNVWIWPFEMVLINYSNIYAQHNMCWLII